MKMECFFCVSPEEGVGEVTECSKCACVNHCEKHKEVHMPVTQSVMCLPFKVDHEEHQGRLLRASRKVKQGQVAIFDKAFTLG